MPTVKVYSHIVFDNYCKDHNITDDNVETEHNDTAFISIICTDDVQTHYLGEEEYHWFKQNHSNVLNLEFDDVTHDIDWYDFTAHAITDEQAKQIVEFIEKNKDKDMKIHCRAGISRSSSVGMFCVNHYGYEMDDDTKGYIRPNNEVTRKLNRVLWTKSFKEDGTNIN